MKKELIVGGFLILMLAAAIINIHYLNKLTDKVTHLIEESERYTADGDWSSAEKKAEEASHTWDENDTYTHLVLRHPEIEATTDSIYGYIEQIYSKDQGAAKGAAKAAIARLKSISSIEQIRLGSIF